MAKQFTFYQLGWDGGTIDLNKRGRGSWALLVHPMGHQFLSGTVGTRDEHPCIRWSHFFDHFFNGFDFLALADHLVIFGDFFLEHLVLHGKFFSFKCIAHRGKQSVQIRWL